MFKNKLILKITFLKKIEEKLEIVETKYINLSKKEITKNLQEEKIETISVNKEPEKWQLGKFYVRLDGKMVYTYQLLED